jgi:hypothetical protein
MSRAIKRIGQPFTFNPAALERYTRADLKREPSQSWRDPVRYAARQRLYSRVTPEDIEDAVADVIVEVIGDGMGGDE